MAGLLSISSTALVAVRFSASLIAEFVSGTPHRGPLNYSDRCFGGSRPGDGLLADSGILVRSRILRICNLRLF